MLFGAERSIPEAVGCKFTSELVRWRVIRDGLGECIKALPLSDRGLATRLGEVWAYADSQLDAVKGSRGEWPSLF